MDIGLRLRGRAADAASLLERAKAWFERRPDSDPAPRASLEEDLLAVDLHPAAEPLLLERCADGLVRLAANTGTAGPGYHRHVVTLALELGEALGVAWEREGADSTGWLTAGDERALEAAFLDGLRELAEAVLALAAEGKRGFGLLLPAGHVYEHDALVATSVGPRDEAWAREVAADPRRGIELLPWWGPGRDARYYLELARVHLWLDVRWRAPIEGSERELLDRVATWLERAHGLDPDAPVPWREQSELLQLLGEESLRATRAHLEASKREGGAGRGSRGSRGPAETARIGYRRRSVRALLSGGWSLRVPGELAERWEERGTWVAYDERRSVWFTSMSVHDERGTPSPSTEATLASLPPLGGDEPLEFERGDLRGVAAFVEEEHEGQRVFRLEAHAARGEHAAVGTIVFADESLRDWALECWGSIAHAVPSR